MSEDDATEDDDKSLWEEVDEFSSADVNGEPDAIDPVSLDDTTDTELLDTDPAETDPDDPEPVEADPVDAESIDADPVDSEPVDTDPVGAEPIDAEPIDAEPVDADPVDAEPGGSEPTGAERIVDDPAGTGADSTDEESPEADQLADDDAPDADEVFDEMDVSEVDGEALWDELANETDVESVETDEIDDPEGGEGPLGSASTVSEEAKDAEADTGEALVDKRVYCQQCPYFSKPPEVHCSHEETSIVEILEDGQFRVTGCPVVTESGPDRTILNDGH